MTSQAADARSGPGWLQSIGAIYETDWSAPDLRRRLQLALAGIWLLDAVLQFQAFMFSRGFSQMLAGTGPGNPAVIADPISWAAKIIAQNGTVTNAIFAAIQLLIALGIAWRPTLRLALGASIIWSVGVWWFGEGLGGVLNGAGSPANGAPGAVIIYALLAVLLWPTVTRRPGPFAAAWSAGAGVARALWLVLWGSLAVMALLPATRAAKAFGGMVSGMASGQPGWLAAIDNHLASFLTSNGPAMAVVLAVVLAAVAISVYLPPPPLARAGVVLAVLTAAFIWLGEGLGGILTGGGTDPNSGLLLALVTVAYWPVAARSAVAPGPASAAAAAQSDLAPAQSPSHRQGA